MSLPWFRLYAEAVDDEKLRLLAFEDRWHFVALLCCKCQGIFDCPDDDFLRRKLAVKLGVQLRELEEIHRRLCEVDLVDERMQPKKWDARQFVSDVSTDRVRKYRNKKKKTKGKVKRYMAVSETDQIQSRTDTEKEPPLPPGLDEAAWQRWVQYRKQIRKPIKPASVLAAQRKLAGFGADQVAVVEQSIANGWQGLFSPKEGGNGAGKQVGKPSTRFTDNTAKLRDWAGS